MFASHILEHSSALVYFQPIIREIIKRESEKSCDGNVKKKIRISADHDKSDNKKNDIQ